MTGERRPDGSAKESRGGRGQVAYLKVSRKTVTGSEKKKTCPSARSSEQYSTPNVKEFPSYLQRGGARKRLLRPERKTLGGDVRRSRAFYRRELRLEPKV